MDVETLRGIAVVSLAEGLRLGRIDEALFSTQPLQVRAWQVRADDGLFVIPIDQVRSVGTDAIIVESSQVTHAAGSAGASNALVSTADLKHRKVVDDAGTFIGMISRIDVEPATGRVLAFAVHKGGVLGIGGTTTTMDADAIISLGPELVTVRQVPTEDTP